MRAETGTSAAARGRWRHMMRRLLLTYAVVELIVLIGLAATIGVGWTLLVLLATFVLGLVLWAPLAGWQLSSQIAQLRSGLKEPRVALSDGAVVALASGLILVPGAGHHGSGAVAAGAADTGGRAPGIGRASRCADSPGRCR